MLDDIGGNREHHPAVFKLGHREYVADLAAYDKLLHSSYERVVLWT